MCFEIHKKYAHLSANDKNSILTCLQRGMNLTDTAKFINSSVSTIKKEIDRNKELYITDTFNKCGKKKDCTRLNICGRMTCPRTCSKCTTYHVNCNNICSEFTTKPVCKRLKKLGGICNFCHNNKGCRLNKWYYDPTLSHKVHVNNMSVSHTKPHASLLERQRVASLLLPYLKKNLSIAVILNKLKDEIPYSIQTIYTWVDKGYLPGIDNITLTRKVRYTPRKKKIKSSEIDREYYNGREYSDFINYITEHPFDEVVEMDTVEGTNHGSFILTLLFRKSNYLMAFKLKDHTSASVTRVFNNIKKELGLEIFKRTFKVILTDRGSEFSNPVGIEVDEDTREILTRVFFCDSRQSQQKGKIEKDHVELRKIFPKGTDFNQFNQSKLNLALSHVNSYPRQMFSFRSPMKVAKQILDKSVFELNHCREIEFNSLILNPSLLKK